jgi:hypothetical protein
VDDQVHQSSQPAPAGVFGEWRVHYAESTVTDPAAAVPASGDPIFTWRNPAGEVVTTTYRVTGTAVLASQHVGATARR